MITQRFPMTTGGLVKFTTALSAVILAVVLPIQLYVVATFVPVGPLRAVVFSVLGLTVLGLGWAFLLAPRAVRLTGSRLAVERLAWTDFEVPLREVTSFSPGPAMGLLGPVRRVAGNGGLMGFTGLFHVPDVGLVRAWVTQLGVPTVIVRRAGGRPLLLGVDAPGELEAALHQAGVPRQ
ncbi:MAG: hypothetical protein U0228_38810 [Myxococcaceae bacterium]